MRAMIKVTLHCGNPNCGHTAEVLLMETNSKDVMPMHDWLCAKCLTLMSWEISMEAADAYKQERSQTDDDHRCSEDSGDVEKISE